MPVPNYLANRGFAAIAHAMHGVPTCDVHSGMRGYRTSVIRAFDFDGEGDALPSDTLLYSATCGYRVFALLNLFARPMPLIKGYAPGNMGLGEDLPRDVMLQWIRWVMNDRYFFDDKTLSELSNFGDYHGALCALCFSDDPWATRPAVELLCSGFTGTKPDIQTIEPAASGVDKIGHFGFFRDTHRDTLWKGAGDWLRTWSD